MKARIGSLVRVKNKDKKHHENEFYYSVILKDGSGVTKFIFTEAEFIQLTIEQCATQKTA